MRRWMWTLGAAALTLTVSAPLLAVTASGPVRKPGWWEMMLTITVPTAKPTRQTVHICTDPAVDQVQSPFGVHQGSPCPPVEVKPTAGGWSIAARCALAHMTVATTGQATGDLNSRYHVDLVTHITPPPTPDTGEVKIAIDARWLSACPAGKKPGDVDLTMSTNVAPPAKPSPPGHR